MLCILQPLDSGVLKAAGRPCVMSEDDDMFLKKVEGPRQITLPDGTILSRADLPRPDTRRWVASRKAVVVRAVVYGLITRAEAMERYALSDEEFDLWIKAVERFGDDALKVTALQKYRQL